MIESRATTSQNSREISIIGGDLVDFNPAKKRRPQLKNRCGQRFGRLLIYSIFGTHRKSGVTYWLARCSCGTWRTLPGPDLASEHTKSCGCLSREKFTERVTLHGESRVGQTSREYVAYCMALSRCSVVTDRSYSRYGGRGIEFRFNSFEEFFVEIGRKPSPKHSLDRIDNNGHYEKGNVRWATQIEQARNKRNNLILTWRGQTKTAPEWAEMFGVDPRLLHDRHKRGWSDDRILEALNQSCPV